MREKLSISCTPLDEPCVQVRSDVDYVPMMKRECTAFMNQLQRMADCGEFGDPSGAFFQVVTEHHDFGPYKEVNVNYDDRCEEAENFAFKVESNIPLKWDDEAVQELGSDYFVFVDLYGA